jgi:hypothetical protein
MAVGWLIGKARSVAPLDGFWLTNPASVIVGLILCNEVSREAGSVLEHWGLTVWALRGVAACPIYAWLFFAAASGLRRGPAG